MTEALISLQLPPDHPALAGHFPGRPIIPGVVLLDAIIRAARERFALGAPSGLPRAKFLRPITGGAPLTVRLRLSRPRRIVYEARAGADIVALGDLEFGASGDA